MENTAIQDTALVIALALFAGIVAQTVAQHLRIPGIVLLLAGGVLLGPDGVNLIQPQRIGMAIHTLVGYAVAIILFEGGMNLNIRRLLRESLVIRRLITLGAVITALGGALAARLIMGWDWTIAVLFGTLIIVTGPTVINPLLRRTRIKRTLETILEAEGVLIDPVGAIIALVTLEALIHPAQGPFFISVFHLGMRLLAGAVVGLAGGAIIALVLRPRRLIPDGMSNIFTLTAVLALYHISNLIQPESGIGAVTVAGLTVGNFGSRVLRELMEFKEQLTVMLIGMLFIVLAADIRLAEIQQLGVPGVITVLAVMLLIRPVNVAVCTLGTGLTWREKTFLSWLAPRGIVAAAIASLFALTLVDAGIEQGKDLRAIVFLVIAMTVTIQGLTGGTVAGLLKLRRETNRGYAILGASDLSRALGRALKEGGERVIIIDSNPDATRAAEQDGLKTIFGNAFEERIAQRAHLEDMAGCIGLTPNEEVNFLFARMAKRDLKVGRRYVALHVTKGHVTEDMIHTEGGNILFGGHRDLDLWSIRLRRKIASRERWRLTENLDYQAIISDEDDSVFIKTLLFLAAYSDGKAYPVDETTQFKKDMEVSLLIFEEMRSEAVSWLESRGCVKTEMPDNIK